MSLCHQRHCDTSRPWLPAHSVALLQPSTGNTFNLRWQTSGFHGWERKLSAGQGQLTSRSIGCSLAALGSLAAGAGRCTLLDTLTGFGSSAKLQQSHSFKHTEWLYLLIANDWKLLQQLSSLSPLLLLNINQLVVRDCCTCH